MEGLSERYGNWHTIYVRLNRWAKSGVLQKIFLPLQEKGVIRIGAKIISLGSASIKVHPDGMGALKKRKVINWKVARRLEYKDSYGYRF